MLSKTLLILGVILLLVVLIAVAVGYAVSGPRYTGPVSNHFDGK